MSHFQLLEDHVLGEGRHGKVYKCIWYGSMAAAKKFNVTEAEETEEILQEIELLKALQNDYIIQFMGSHHHKGSLCLITSYAENGSLYKSLEKHQLPQEHKRSIIGGIIEGMLFLRNRSVIHRDLKSLNILLDRNFTPKLCDFGLAALKLNSATLAIGTTRWMAPELMGLQPRYSYASDIYALGLVIWEIYTEKIPFQETVNDTVIMDAVKNGASEDIPGYVPEYIQQLIRRCWHFDPNKRITILQLKDEYNKVHLQTDSNACEDVYDDDLTSSVANTHLPHLPAQQQRSNMDINNETSMAELNLIDSQYIKICEQYSKHYNSRLNNKNDFTSMLNKLGDNFVQWIKATAGQDQGAPMTMIGEMYYHGWHVPQDLHTAFEHFEAAAKQGHARAQYCLGFMYAEGQEVEQNDKKSLELYAKAAEQGLAAAQSCLGTMYATGRGVMKDYHKAVELLSKSAEQGDATAQAYLGFMYQKGEGVEQDYSKAVELYSKAAENGEATALAYLGIMYQYGLGVVRSLRKAVKLYSKAVEQGHISAQVYLGLMYQNGLGVEQDYTIAMNLYLRAADQGDATAQNILRFMYMQGVGDEQDLSKALKVLTKAAEQGNTNARTNLEGITEVIELHSIPDALDFPLPEHLFETEYDNWQNIGEYYPRAPRRLDHRVCGNWKPFLCAQCMKLFARGHDLTRHDLSVHTHKKDIRWSQFN